MNSKDETRAVKWAVNNALDNMHNYEYYPIEVAIPIETNYAMQSREHLKASHIRVRVTHDLLMQHIKEQDEKILKLNAIYNKANLVACEVGCEGSIDNEHYRVGELLAACHDLDGGRFERLPVE